jgi:hypothetical protein
VQAATAVYGQVKGLTGVDEPGLAVEEPSAENIGLFSEGRWDP